MKSNVANVSASKLFQVLVVGGLSLAAGCSSAPTSGGDAGAAEDATGQDATKKSPSDSGAAGDDATKRKDVATHDDASDSAPSNDVSDDSCIPWDARVDFPNEAGFCMHGLCAW
jgi:hypothetical protein